MTYWLNSEDYRDINTAMVESLEPYKNEIYPRLRQKTKDKKLAQIKGLMKEVEEME